MLGHKLIPNASLLDATLHFRQDIWFVYLQHFVTDLLAGNRNAASPESRLNLLSIPSSDISSLCLDIFSKHCQRPKLHTSDRNLKPLHDYKNLCLVCDACSHAHLVLRFSDCNPMPRNPQLKPTADALRGVGELPQLQRLRAYRRTAERQHAVVRLVGHGPIG